MNSKFLLILQSGSSHSVLPRWIASALPGNLIETQIMALLLNPIEFKTLEVGPSNFYFNQSSRLALVHAEVCGPYIMI